MAELFVASEELEDKGNEIIKLYNKYLGRDPLQGGLDGWLATGQSIEQIEQGIANSPEAGVFQTFNETIGRDPTMEERDYFVNVNPAPIEAVEEVLSNTQEAQQFQTQQQLDETDLLADTTAGDTTADDIAVDDSVATEVDSGATDNTSAADSFPTADTGQFGDMIDASATFAGANQYLGVNEAQWSAFVNEVNDIKAQMNAFEGNEARVMQDRSTPDMLLDRRINVLMTQNPGMTADEARAEAEASPEYQQMVATNQQYEALNSRLNQLYASIGLDSQGSITGSDMGVEGGIVRFDLQNGGVTFEALGNPMAKGLIIAAAAAIFTGPLATALGPASAGGAGIFSSAAAAKAASGAIISAASQLAATGELDIGQALVSAAMSYGGTQLGDAVKNSGVIGDIASQVESTANSAVNFLSQGNSIAEAAIKAGGMSMLSQLVTTGEVSLEQAGIAALIAGGAEGINELAVASGRDVDEFMADLAEQEEFQQAAIDADIKDPFLNPNYQTVGDGSVVLNTVTNEVFSVSTNQSLGQFDSLDANSDGVLSASDLQEAGVTAQQVTPNLFDYKMGDTVYVDASGSPVNPDTVKFGPNGFVYSDGNLLSTKPYNEVFGGDRGGLVWNSEGGTEGTINYENGDLAYQKVSTTQTLYDAQGNPYESEVSQWVDAQGNIVDDPQLTDELTLIAAKAIDTPLESITYYDQDGNPIDYNYAPYKLRDSYESGQYSGTIFGKDGSRYQWDDATGLYKYSPTTADAGYTQEVWYDPTTGTEYVKVEDKLTINKVDLNNIVEPVEPVVVETTDASGGATSTSEQAVTALTESLSSSTSSESAASAVTNAAASGLSAAEIATAVNSALSGGAISSETASAASSALEDIASKGDVSDAGVLSASGDLATDTGSDGATVTTVTQPPGLLTGNNITTGAGVSGSDPNNASAVTVSSGNVSTTNNAANNITGSASGVKTGGSGLNGSDLDGSGLSGSGVDGSGVDGSGLDGSGLAGVTGVNGVTGVTGSNNVTTTTNTSTTAGTATTPTTGLPGPGTTVTVGNGKDPGDDPGDGPSDNGGDGLDGTGMLTALAALPTMAAQPFEPLTQRSIRFDAPTIQPVQIAPTDARKELDNQLARLLNDPQSQRKQSLFGGLV